MEFLLAIPIYSLMVPQTANEGGTWYLMPIPEASSPTFNIGNPVASGAASFVTFFILFSSMIPISVSKELNALTLR